MPRPSELDDLAVFSAHVGRDPLLIQGSVGNTSIKLDGRLWIKASGKWLANALQEDIFLALDLCQTRSSIRRHREITTAVTNSGKELTPSIETAMHAILPHRVVVHVHSVNTIARAVRSDAREHLEQRLNGLKWEWVPYALSGLPLAREIERVVKRSPASNVLILANHGLVVCGNDCRSVDLLLKQVELRMASIPRRAPRFDRTFLLYLADESHWCLPDDMRLHCLATDEISRRILANGVLYPCQTLVPGGADAWRQFYPGLFRQVRRKPEKGPCRRSFLILKDKGMLLSNRITRMEIETLIGLAEVVQRIEMNAPIRYLTKAECEEICLSGYQCAGHSQPAHALQHTVRDTQIPWRSATHRPTPV